MRYARHGAVVVGLALSRAVSGEQAAVPSVWWLAATMLGTLLAIAALTVIPSVIGARQLAAIALQAEPV